MRGVWVALPAQQTRSVVSNEIGLPAWVLRYDVAEGFVTIHKISPVATEPRSGLDNGDGFSGGSVAPVQCLISSHALTPDVQQTKPRWAVHIGVFGFALVHGPMRKR